MRVADVSRPERGCGREEGEGTSFGNGDLKPFTSQTRRVKDYHCVEIGRGSADRACRQEVNPQTERDGKSND